MSKERIRGAVYIPARAYNAYQLWKEYDPATIERDFGLARSLGLNALRLWCSYEWWLEDTAGLQKSIDHFFAAAEKAGLSILISAFEGCGVEPTPQSLNDKDPWTAMCIASPGEAVITDSAAWAKPLAYLGWLMERVGRKANLLALEPMNEPRHTVPHTRFVRGLFQELRRLNAPCVLSHGSLGGLLFNMLVMDLGVQILQVHDNFPKSAEAFEANLKLADMVSRGMDKQVHITEWQRVRSGDSGWEGGTVLSKGEWAPDLASLAPSMDKYPQLGSFFWSLMLKPAYLPPQRKKGTLNGIFHEDGSVFSLADARAVSGNPNFKARERREWPEWAAVVPKKAGIVE